MRTLQLTVPASNVFAGAVYVVAEPVTVARLVQSPLPLRLYCSSALVCVVPVAMIWFQLKVMGMLPSTREPTGDIGTASERLSTVESMYHSLVADTPELKVTVTCHWTVSVVNVPAGIVKPCSVPTLIVCAAPDVPAR